MNKQINFKLKLRLGGIDINKNQDIPRQWRQKIYAKILASALIVFK